MMDKRALRDAFRAGLLERLEALVAASGGAQDGARVDGSHRPANRGERAAVTSQGYLAHGLSQRIAALTDDLRVLDAVDLGPRDRVTVGAIVAARDEEDDVKRYFILPGGQGDAVGPVLVVSPSAPVARALAGLREGDEATVRLGARAALLTVELVS